MRAAFAALLVLLAMASPDSAHAAKPKLCSGQTGKVFVRKKCKGDEKVFSLSTILSLTAQKVQETSAPIGPAGGVGSTGATGPIGLTGLQGNKGLTSIAHGPRGVLDFSGCHKVTSGPATASGEVSLAASCDSQNEFLYDDGWSISGSRAFVQFVSRNSSNGINGEVMPYSTLITTTLPAGGSYTLTVSAICCPR